MKISKNGQYALISAADLAMRPGHEPSSISGIADRNKIDKGYLSQIFIVLKKAGIVSSVRGKNGGYFLSKAPSALAVGEVVRAVEGNLAPTRCSIDDNAAQNCEVYDACITRTLWRKIAQEINLTLDGITIADIIEKYKKGNMPNETK